MKRAVASVAVLGLLAACAQQPESIAATQFQDDLYSGKNCRTLKVEHYNLTSQLSDYEAAQRREANKDAAWVAGGALLFFPAMAVAMTGEDYADEISKLKGKIHAVEAQMVRGGC